MIRDAVGDTGIAYQVDGAPNGASVVFINSLGTDHRLWDGQMPSVQHDYLVVRYDSCGHGVSDVPNGRMTIARFGEQLIALLDHLEIDRTALCGCSLGGAIALWLAVYHPERITGVVLANTGARLGTEQSWTTRIMAVEAGGMAAIRDAVLARFLTAAFRVRKPEVAGLIGGMLDATNPQGYIAACEALRDSDLRPVVATVRVPTLVIGSDRDESTPLAFAEELHAGIAGSELVIIPNAAHLSNVERPDVFNPALRGFLDQVAAGGGQA